MRRALVAGSRRGGQGGAAVRSAARSRADRARGLRATSSGRGLSARRRSSRKLGAGRRSGDGLMARSARRGAAAPPQKILDPPIFERMERHDCEPAARHQQPLGRAEPAIELAELVVDRDAQRLKGAGRRIEARLGSGTAARTIWASSRVRRIGAAAGAATIARAIRRAKRSSPNSRISRGKLILGRRRDEIGGALSRRRSCACRAARRGGTRTRVPRCRAASRRRRDRA